MFRNMFYRENENGEVRGGGEKCENACLSQVTGGMKEASAQCRILPLK